MAIDLSILNKEQLQAVRETEGPCIILAGAGSGKTRVLTYRTIYLIDKGVLPENILLTTFTNKAASEMKERIQKLLGVKHSVFVTTFHSFCAKILRIEGKHMGLSQNFVIYDVQDQLDAIKEAMTRLDISVKSYKPSSILGAISDAKNQLMDSSAYGTIARGHFQQVVTQVYSIYQSLLKENDALDFDDLLFKTIGLFKTNQEILEKYQHRFRYILVDEYQDTNHAQYFLTKLLSAKWKNICVVGDFSQSIYSWRGADFQNLTRFKDDYPGAKTFALSQNYRSTQKILDAAHGVISKNTTHPVLSLWTENPQGDDIILYQAKNEHDEAEYVIREVLNLKFYPPKDFSITNADVAVLYRTNAQSRALEEVFLHNAIPYVLVGGTKFYERKEIKDVLAYLRVLQNPKDTISYKRLEKLGKARLARFVVFQEEYLELENKKTIDILDEVLRATEYVSLYDPDDPEDIPRLENIKELRSVAIEFPTLTYFLENVALVEQEHMPDAPNTIDGKKDAITLMTLHAAKGLEFGVVFMVGMEEGLFPHSRTLMDKNELEEERRLCYVGMTRAKKRLYLTFAKQRLFFGQRSSNIVSRFVMDLPENILSNNLQYIQDRKDPDLF